MIPLKDCMSDKWVLVLLGRTPILRMRVRGWWNISGLGHHEFTPMWPCRTLYIRISLAACHEFSSSPDSFPWAIMSHLIGSCQIKLNAGVLSHFFALWIGPGTAWINEVNFFFKLPPSSIDFSILDSVQHARTGPRWLPDQEW